MADDMGIGDTSAYLGVKLIPQTEAIGKTLKTPNIEKLSNQGMIFTDAPASMCSSTRYSLLTGRLSHRSYLKKQGWLPNGPSRPMIHRELTTLPEMLKGTVTPQRRSGSTMSGWISTMGTEHLLMSSTSMTLTSPSPSWTGRLTMALMNSSGCRETPRTPLTPNPECTFATTGGPFRTARK